ncbi:transmembrane protein 229A [Danio rerio]|uniref:Transmembrane protein 229A n=1 Tax=Danio rerio TaxID=7955 RepID=A0A8M1Q1D9_DANRE|nr:transmembrane protein 229A [Danio rerio]|eukprot:XP_001334732.2 transmembrane protein 229A [Danio rerio]
MMRSRRADNHRPRDATALPQWMRMYFYGMHGVTLDILLSSIHRFLDHGDPQLLGFSSPYLCVVHSFTHLALEKIYLQKRCFQERPVVFHLVFYPCLYICLQILIGNLVTCTESITVSVTQLTVHYILALYFAYFFHKRFLGLHYQNTAAKSHLNAVPGVMRFVFFGMHGFLDEVLFTSVFNLFEKGELRGHTSLWSFLMYGSCSFVVEKLYLFLHFRRGWGISRRLPIYICFIYTWEFSWGFTLRRFGACSWDYSHYPFHFMGLVTLMYLPGWVCLSLYQDVLSNVLLRIVYDGKSWCQWMPGAKREA